MPCNWC